MAIGLKPLEDIIELSIISCWIKPKPVSLGIFAPPEYGKLSLYFNTQNVKVSK